MLVFFIKKKNSFFQLIQNYRTLNIMTIKNKYLLLLIYELVIKLQEVYYFTKLNIHQGFNNINIKPSNNQKTIFCTNYRLLVIFFGIINNPAIFQTIINDIFWNLIVEGIMVVYLDNILIFTQILEKYYKVVYRVIEVLAKHNLFLCSEKCKFNRQQIEYLYFVIFKNQVKINSVKFMTSLSYKIVLNCRFFLVSPSFISDLSVDFPLLCAFSLILQKVIVYKYEVQTNRQYFVMIDLLCL